MSEIKRATRQGVRPLIGLYGESGTGKTYSSLLLARGFVGPAGRMCLVDSESGRGSLYADVVPGGYDTLQLDPPFSPANYCAAIEQVEAAGYAVGIVDSGSHEWEGQGGILDQAAANEERSGKTGLHCWRAPKLEHAKFILRLLRSRIPWVICLRAKHKSRQGKDDRGKTVIIKDDHTSPLQSEEFLFEMTAHGEVMPDHSFRVTKHSHPTLLACFESGKPISIATGERLAAWCGSASITAPASKPTDTVAALKARLWTVTAPLRDASASRTVQLGQVMKALAGWHILEVGQELGSLTAEQLTTVINQTEIAMQERATT